MFKRQHYHIIFIILLILALQFQLLHPAYVESVSRVCVCGRLWCVHSPEHLCGPSREPLKPLFDSLKD